MEAATTWVETGGGDKTFLDRPSQKARPVLDPGRYINWFCYNALKGS
jgi:hypothetical protein